MRLCLSYLGQSVTFFLRQPPQDTNGLTDLTMSSVYVRPRSSKQSKKSLPNSLHNINCSVHLLKLFYLLEFIDFKFSLGVFCSCLGKEFQSRKDKIRSDGSNGLDFELQQRARKKEKSARVRKEIN